MEKSNFKTGPDLLRTTSPRSFWRTIKEKVRFYSGHPRGELKVHGILGGVNTWKQKNRSIVKKSGRIALVQESCVWGKGGINSHVIPGRTQSVMQSGGGSNIANRSRGKLFSVGGISAT